MPTPQPPETPNPYEPGGAERARLLTDILAATAVPGEPPAQTQERVKALADWIDQNV